MRQTRPPKSEAELEELAKHFGLTEEDKAYFDDLFARVKKMEKENPIEVPPGLSLAEHVDYVLTQLGWQRKK